MLSSKSNGLGTTPSSVARQNTDKPTQEAVYRLAQDQAQNKQHCDKRMHTSNPTQGTVYRPAQDQNKQYFDIRMYANKPNKEAVCRLAQDQRDDEKQDLPHTDNE